MSVYSTMLDHMSDEHKITVTAKLAQEVLSAAIDGGLPLAASPSASSATPRRNSAAFSISNRRNSLRPDRSAADLDVRQKASAVVKDALLVMASSGIRVGARGGPAAGDFDDGAGNGNLLVWFWFDFFGWDGLVCLAWVGPVGLVGSVGSVWYRWYERVRVAGVLGWVCSASDWLGWYGSIR